MDSLYRGRKIKLSDLKIDPIKILKDHYGVQALGLEPVKAVGKVKLADKFICFKRFKEENEEKVWFIYSAISHLLNNGFRKTAPFILNKDGLPFTKKGKEIFYVTEWIKGFGCDFSKPWQLKQGAITLAQMHEASRGFIPAPESKPKVLLGKWPKIFSTRFEDLISFKKRAQDKTRKTKFDRAFLDIVDFYIEYADKATTLMNTDYYQKLIQEAIHAQTFTHRDVADRNFIIVPSGEAHIIDFDYCRLDIRANDLLRMIERTLKDLNWDFETCKYIIKSYQLINKIKPEEFIILFSFLLFPQKLWRTADRYYNSKDEWSDEELNLKLQEFIERKSAHQKFIEEFFRQYCRKLIDNPFY